MFVGLARGLLLQGGGIGRHLRGMQGGVKVWLRELLNPESEGEVRGRQNHDGVLRDCGLAAAGWSHDEDNLNVREGLQYLLDESGALEVESIPNGRADVVQRDLGMVLERRRTFCCSGAGERDRILPKLSSLLGRISGSISTPTLSPIAELAFYCRWTKKLPGSTRLRSVAKQGEPVAAAAAS